VTVEHQTNEVLGVCLSSCRWTAVNGNQWCYVWRGWLR